MAVNKKVFINCPFDQQYFPILKAILFTNLCLGLEPLISETTNSGESRFRKIRKFIRDSSFSIHDLSRIEPLKADDLPRMNMPFELGLDFGAKYFNKSLEKKKFLILEAERFRYQKVISDISGHDIRQHNNQPVEAIKAVRNWLATHVKGRVPSYKMIWSAYQNFRFEYDQTLKSENIDPEAIGDIPFSEIIREMKGWIKNELPDNSIDYPDFESDDTDFSERELILENLIRKVDELLKRKGLETDSEKQGLLQTQKVLQEKLNHLRIANASLTDGAKKFEVMKDIEQIEKEIKKIELSLQKHSLNIE